MTKICGTDECNIEIQDWQTYCPKHYAERLAQQQQSQAQNMGMQSSNQPQPPKTPEPIKSQEAKELPLPAVDEKERLIIKQVSLKSAIELMKTLDNEGKEFKDLMDEVETLTVYFYKIIVRKNESLS